MKKLTVWLIGFFLLFSTFSYGKASNVVIATIGVENSSSEIAVTPNNFFVYVANNNNDSILNDDSVSILDLTYNRLTPYYVLQQSETITKSNQQGPHE